MRTKGVLRAVDIYHMTLKLLESVDPSPEKTALVYAIKNKLEKSSELSPAQRRVVLGLQAHGPLTRAQMCDKFFISPKTIENPRFIQTLIDYSYIVPVGKVANKYSNKKLATLYKATDKQVK